MTERATAPETEARTPRFAIERDFAGRQMLGSRHEQQDSYAFFVAKGSDEHAAEAVLAVVADGMGGHEGGAEASEAAITEFVGSFQSQSGDLVSRLPVALRAANEEVGRLTDRDRSMTDAGTTLLAVLVEGDKVNWISVGDSPLFVWSEGKLRRLNADHSVRSVLARKVERREMRAEDAEKHPDRGVLLSALVGESPEMVDFPAKPFCLRPENWLLACSDGVLGAGEEAISEIFTKAGDVEEAAALAEKLLHAVSEKKLRSQDNATACVLRLPWQSAGGGGEGA